MTFYTSHCRFSVGTGPAAERPFYMLMEGLGHEQNTHTQAQRKAGEHKVTFNFVFSNGRKAHSRLRTKLSLEMAKLKQSL